MKNGAGDVKHGSEDTVGPEARTPVGLDAIDVARPTCASSEDSPASPNEGDAAQILANMSGNNETSFSPSPAMPDSPDPPSDTETVRPRATRSPAYARPIDSGCSSSDVDRDDGSRSVIAHCEDDSSDIFLAQPTAPDDLSSGAPALTTSPQSAEQLQQQDLDPLLAPSQDHAVTSLLGVGDAAGSPSGVAASHRHDDMNSHSRTSPLDRGRSSSPRPESSISRGSAISPDASSQPDVLDSLSHFIDAGKGPDTVRPAPSYIVGRTSWAVTKVRVA